MELYEHQIKCLNETKNFNKVAYYLDMGLGKTFVGSEKLIQLKARMNLVICQKSKIKDWKKHFEEFYPYVIISDLTTKQGYEYFRLANEGKTQLIGFHVGIVNYELAWRRKELLNLKDFTLMLDESSLIQNKTAKQTKFILKLNPKNTILLSGTPCSGKYENLWTQINLLGWNISEDLYNKQYVNWKSLDLGKFKTKIVDKDDPYKNIERLKDKLRLHGSIFMKTEECFNLPKQNFITIECETPEFYKKFMKTNIITIDTLNLIEFHDESDFEGVDITPRIELVGDTSLTKRLYARMICSRYNKNKLNNFKELIQSTKDRLIVFYNFNNELEKLKEICSNQGKEISIVNGQTKDLKAYETEENSVTLIQYQAGAMGLNLQKANKIIYFSLPERSELFEQSKKRIHRIGQDKPCFYYYLITEKTIEVDILETLKMRKDYTDELFKLKEGE